MLTSKLINISRKKTEFMLVNRELENMYLRIEGTVLKINESV